ncbi:MAG: NAD(+)/NADH kinase [Peptococcaceae bacterium]|nr:NAD(+)/NADH kinase [Peptococcaceae bacterium]
MTPIAALCVNRMKINSGSLVHQIRAWLKARGWQTVVWETEYYAGGGTAAEEEQDISFVLSLGGDGTVLEVAREAARQEIPVLGVNYGRLGFLCEVEQTDIFSALERILQSDFTVEERLMLTACLLNGEPDRTVSRVPFRGFTVLNDVVFARKSTDAMIALDVKLTGETIASPPCDGVIIATPTGSTAYSLSAGGPVVSPGVEAILITHLAAHALSSRPMVVSHKDVLDVTLACAHPCRVAFDGQNSLILQPGQTVRIKASDLKARFIRFAGSNFPKMVREKLGERS